MFEKLSISVVIVQYGNTEYLRECLFSLQLHCPEGLSEIVVVNNNIDSIEQNLSGFPLARELFLGKNVGFGAAANAGASFANGEILVFLNPDAILLLSNGLDRIVSLVKKNGGGIVGARLLDESYHTETWGGGKKATLGKIVQKRFGCIRKNFFSKREGVSFVDWVSGAAFAVRRDDFFKQGGFDEHFFLYFEDMDLCGRFRSAGLPVRHDSGAAVLHRGGKAFSGKKDQKKHYYASQQLYFEKHRPRWEYRILKKLHQWFF